MKDLYIIGAGGFGRETAWLVERINKDNLTWNLKGFIDDDPALWGNTEDGYPVLGGCDYLVQQPEAYCVCAVGASRTRKKIIGKIEEKVLFATLIDPSVLMSDRMSIGEGTIICAGNILTVDIEIGKHNIINLDCTVGHDAVLEDFVTLYPSVNVSGNVTLEECAEIGTGAQIIQGKRIGSEIIVGAGAVVIKNLPGGCTAVGSPARVVKYKR